MMPKYLSMYRVYDCEMCGNQRNAETDRFGVVGMSKVICQACVQMMTEQQLEFDFVKDITNQ